MFYDKNLMNDETLGILWKLANKIPENIRNHDLSRICTELDSRINVALVPDRRLSLRTSSTLINGAAMLYQQSMNQLLDDVIKLDEDLVQRRRRKHCSSSDTSVTNSSGSSATPEEMRRQPTADFNFDSSFSPTKRPKLDHTAPDKSTLKITMSRSSIDNLTSDETENSKEENSKNKSKNDDNLDSENSTEVVNLTGENVVNNSISENIGNQRKDKEVQTSPILPSRSGSKSLPCIDQSFDPNLPFGCILIHDNYRSRIPSRIVFTSLNSSVRNLK